MRLVVCGLALVLVGGCAVLSMRPNRVEPPPGTRPVVKTFQVTGYCKCGDCCGWKRNWLGRPVVASGPNRGRPKKVGMTASGAMVRPGTIAADGKRYAFGTVMYVPGYGYGVVEDRGSAIKGDHIDLYFRSHRKALQWGNRSVKVTVWEKK